MRPEVIEQLMDFHRCPTTGRVIDSVKHDDKVICGCGRTNPRLLVMGHVEAHGVHVKRYLEKATAREFAEQYEKEKRS